MARRTFLMETTEISVDRTSHEISALLVKCGARSLATDYDGAGKIVGLRFQLVVRGESIWFRLPIRTKALLALLLRERGRFSAEQAERVAWRQGLRWLQAQLAFLETEMMKPEEVFFPFRLSPDDVQQTMFEFFENQQKQIAGAR
jgi:hypothetical protein